jgi:hypothetical protein
METFMKTVLSVLLVIATCGLAVMAQNATVPSVVMNHNTPASTAGHAENFSWGPPPAGPNIMFYGGDVTVGDPNEQSFANGNTVLVPNTTTYGAVRVPATGHFVVTGIFFNQYPTQSSNSFDPETATYDIRTGLSSGNGGTSVASGSGPQGTRTTGRLPFGNTEYTTAVALVSPMTATNGTTYWVNESPQCTDTSNTSCTEQFFVDNTTQKTGSVNGGAQPTGQMFFNSAFFGFTWTNWCDPSLGQNSQQCADLSFGIYGHP